MAISELEPNQRDEINDLWKRLRKAPDPDYQQFKNVDKKNTKCGLVSPNHYGEFPDEGSIILEVHGTLSRPDFFSNLNDRLEQSHEEFRPYAIDTPQFAPTVKQYSEELEEAFQKLDSNEEFDSLSIVSHSLGGVGALNWIHEKDRYSDVDKFIASGSPFNGTAAADIAENLDKNLDLMEFYTKSLNFFNPLLGGREIESFYDNFRLSDVTDGFITRKSAEKGKLADLMDQTEITEKTDTYTLRSSIDRFYIEPEKTLPKSLEHLAHLTKYKNKIDSPKIEGAEENFILPSSTHHEIMNGDLASEYIARILEDYPEIERPNRRSIIEERK